MTGDGRNDFDFLFGRWTRPAPDAARWEQAFSADAGATWETNWVMSLRR